MSAAEAKDPAELSFSQAMEQLEAVLHRIEGDEIDIDQLGTELGRAAKLLEVCREKIRRAEIEVQQIVEKIEDDEPAGAGSGREPAEEDDGEADPAGAEPASKAASSGVLWSDRDQDDDIPF